MLQVLKILADETRLKIYAILTQGEFSVQEITRILQMGQSRISRHLKILSDAGVACSRREGSWVFYGLATPTATQASLLTLLKEWVDQSGEFTKTQELIEHVLEQRRSQSRNFFERVGADWDDHDSRYISRRVLFDFLSKRMAGVETLADLGCGDGVAIDALRGKIQTIIGVDNSRERLKAASARLGNLDGVDLRLGNLEHLPLRDNEVDCVLVSLVLHHLAQPGFVFSEFYRVIKPGGAVMIVDFHPHKNEALRREMGDLWLGFQSGEMLKWVDENGFTASESEDIDGGREPLKLFLTMGRKPNN